MTLDDLTVNFEHVNREGLLSDWIWLIGESKLPILISTIGDAFLEDTDDGTVHHLEVAAGQISRVADNIDTFVGKLQDETVAWGPPPDYMGTASLVKPGRALTCAHVILRDDLQHFERFNLGGIGYPALGVVYPSWGPTSGSGALGQIARAHRV